jgi:PPM family protein phosphatase
VLQSNQIVLAGDNGQDRVSVLRDGDRLIFVVADGAGGCSGGAEAAELVIQLTHKHVGLLLSSEDCGKLLGEIDRVVSSDKIAGETTAVIVGVSSTNVFGASIGDSGAWLLNGPNIDDLTQSQVRKPFVGTGAAFPVGFSRDAFGGTLLVATDGLLKYTSREAIASVVQKSNLPDLPEALIKLVRYPSGNLPDDIAIGLCRSI